MKKFISWLDKETVFKLTLKKEVDKNGSTVINLGDSQLEVGYVWFILVLLIFVF